MYKLLWHTGKSIQIDINAHTQLHTYMTIQTHTSKP